MKLSNISIYLGLLSIPLSIVFWMTAPDLAGSPYAKIADEALKTALAQAHAERWGIFVGLWAPSLLILSVALAQRTKN